MRNRAELTDEELGFSCGIKLTLANLFVGIMFGTMAWVPVSLVYAGLELAFPALPTRGGAFGITIGLCLGVAVLWAVIAAERYREISFRFNRVYLKVYRENILRSQILWEDVESVKTGAPYVIQTRQGARVEVPSGALLSERHDNRALKNQLGRFEKPLVVPSPKRFAWIGVVTLIVGMPLFAMSKKPYEIFAETDVLSASVWLRILQSVLGATATVTGVIYLGMALAILGDRKKPHRYEITSEGIREGKSHLRWTEIQHLNCMGSDDMLIQVRLQKGPQRLIDCTKYTNGADLRDTILGTAPTSVTVPLSIGPGLLSGQTLTAKSWINLAGAIGCLSVFALMGLAVVFLAATGRMARTQPSDTIGFEVIGWVSFVFMALVILLACYRVDLNETSIRFQRLLFPASQIAFDEIDIVEIRSNRGKNGPYDLMTIRAKRSSITISSNLEKYGEIRDTILSRVPDAKVRHS